MRKFKDLCAMLGFAALVAAAPAATAYAAPSSGNGGASITAWWDCPPNAFCVWEGRDGNGEWAEILGTVNNLHEYRWGDRIRSVWNRTGRVWCTFVDINQTGATWPVGNWQGNTWRYGRESNITSIRPGAC
ncbi:peptidase inhibitor family I36 protein [Kibdelosporangium aridum]|uniref:peptidase inhibitor family I36 protein n=1 Tax=Kibdelosporangium aridum TaxID=2030 RepID=UPI001359FF6A|nr:peptidase inhibitor family I36 protein [Kibdelosporangium aridum]